MQQNPTDIQVRIARPGELDEAELCAWRDWCRHDAVLQSPYFHPEFISAVDAVRSGVRVAILEDADGLAGFFPFQSGGFQTAQPVGGRLSDFHGVVKRPGCRFSAADLIRRCGLAAWDFTHLPTSQQAFAAHCRAVEGSPFMDLSRGFDTYAADRRQNGSQVVAQTQRKSRKLEREVGRLRFERNVADTQTLQTLMDWKSQQYLRAGWSDVFSHSWARALMVRLHETNENEFGGQLSALYAGNELVALHFGMRSENVLHYWFPAYDPRFEKYSPGLVLLLETARAAADVGISRIDLGKGDQRYKISFGSGAFDVADGSVESGSVLGTVRRYWRNTQVWLKSSPFGTPARVSAKLVRPLREWLSFR